MDCPIDLRQEYGKKYRVTCDPACRRSGHGKHCDQWLAIIPCRNGHIYVHGQGLLGVSTHTAGPLANTLRNTKWMTVTQDGDDGVNATFHPSHTDKVAKMMVARKHRVITPEHRAKLIDAGKAFRVDHGSK